MTLKQFFQQHSRIALAFSGGVDSAYLLYAAAKYHADLKAYYVKTAFQPQFEYEDAQKLADQLHIPMETIHLDVLSDAAVSANPSNRCYYCKRHIMSAIIHAASRDGYSVIIDGTNASDEISDRPGYQALQELKILSPLRMCGLTKQEIRRLSEEAGLFTHNKPAYACLATRIPTGTSITAELLSRTERSEEFMKQLGFSDFRIRTKEDAAVIQLPESQFPLLLQHRETIWKRLKQDYHSVLLDLEVRNES